MYKSPDIVIKVKDLRYAGKARHENFFDYNEAIEYFKKTPKAFSFFCFSTKEWYHTREEFFSAKK